MTSTAPQRRRWPRVYKFVRRLHLYTGLLLLPWLVFFGVSGIFFNHPNVGEQVTGRPLPPPALHGSTGFEAWQPQQVARAVLAQLNERDSKNFRLDDSFTSHFDGPGIFKARTAEGQHTLLVDLSRGAGFLIHRTARSGETPAPFAAEGLLAEPFSLTSVEQKVGPLLQRDDPAARPLLAQPELAPHLRFRVLDEAGQPWNATYNLATGSLDGRPADSATPLGVVQLFSMLHMTHHFPREFGPRMLWALFQDLLGVAMVLWGVSGLILWWQVRPTRVIGVLGIVLSVGLALWISVGLAGDLRFGAVPQALGPGE